VSRDIGELLRIMAALRDPKAGCPWDVEQNFDTIAPYTIEEAYEVADAIDRRDFAGLRDELGDLLLQVVFHARMAEEAGHFRFDDVVEAICDKMTRRHPHVFPDDNGNLLNVADSEAQTSAWEEHKRRERAAGGESDASALAGVSRGLPEWQRALKLQKRASRVGFDWQSPGPVLDKLHEELDEVRHELAAARARRASPTRLAMCYSSGSISRASPASTIRRRCVAPTRSSSAVSGAWRRWRSPMARRCRRRAFRNRRPTGTGPRPRTRRASFRSRDTGTG